MPFVVFIALPAAGECAATGMAPVDGPVPRIDAHSHVFEDLPELNALLRRIDVRTVNVCVSGTDGHLETKHRIAAGLWRQHPDLYPFIATFDLLGREEPDYASAVIAFLGQQFRQGAIGVKIWKEVGMEIKDRAGNFILPDDPRFDPIYAFIAQSGKPLLAHIAEPIDAWRPLDPASTHYHYYSQHPEWHLHSKPGYPSHEVLIAARDNIMKKHPTLVVVGAHLGSLEHDLDGLAERFERFPNFHVDVSARTRDLVRQPSGKVRRWFLKYPDRILYGVDGVWMPFREKQSPAEAQRRAHVRNLELRYQADYDYYAGEGELTYGGRKTEALNLPRNVLEKFYHENAGRIYRLTSGSDEGPHRGSLQ